MAEREWANGGIITPPEGVEPSDTILPFTLGEREQVIDSQGRISCVYGGQLYRIANRRVDLTKYRPLLKAINDWKPDNG